MHVYRGARAAAMVTSRTLSMQRRRPRSCRALSSLGFAAALASAAGTKTYFESAAVPSVCCAVMSVMYHATAGLRPGASQSALGLTATPDTVMLPRSRQAAPVYAGQCWCVARPPFGAGGANSPHIISRASISLQPGHMPAAASSLIVCVRRQLPLLPMRRCMCTAAPSSHMWWHRMPLPA